MELIIPAIPSLPIINLPITRHFAKLVLRMFGFGPLFAAWSFVEPLIEVATALFGQNGLTIGGALWKLAERYISSMTVGGMSVLLLGSGSVAAAGFAVKAVVLVLKLGAGITYLTIDMSSKIVKTAANSVLYVARKAGAVVRYSLQPSPTVTEVPPYWEIEENYMPEKRSITFPPSQNSTAYEQATGKPTTVHMSAQEITALSETDPAWQDAFIECTDEDIDEILGKSSVASSYLQNQDQPTSSESKVPQSSPSSSPKVPEPQHLPVLDRDAFAGFLSHSARLLQSNNFDQKNPTPEQVQNVVAGPKSEWIPSNGSPSPAFAREHLIQSTHIHSSQLRKRDPIVDSWMELPSAPAEGV